MSGNHATLPPSSATRWLKCPGSRKLSEGCPDTESAAAREGTFAHEIAAMALTSQSPAFAMLGHKRDEFRVDDEMVRHLGLYLSAVRKAAMMSDEWFVERRVDFSPECWGTSDAVVISDTVLDVFDLKYGVNTVEVENNDQLRIYGAAALRSIPEAAGCTIINMHIVQPRDFSREDKHRTLSLPRAVLEGWVKDTLEPGIEATKSDKARLNPGDHCTYCPAKAICPALQGRAMEAAREVFPDGEIEKPPLTPPSPSSLTPERLRAVLDAAPLLRKWLDACEETAHVEAKAGRVIPGYKLVATVGNRKWTDEKAAIDALEREGVDPYEKRLMSPNQAQQALGGKKEHKEFVSALCSRAVTGDKLVPESDPRPRLPGGEVFN